ncbi:MAG TPA: hypothetical protein DCR14_03880 [Acidimicrobiaceae bacterium]|nr:hypothetical protein [Acidimicrobiaceae bacterium]
MLVAAVSPRLDTVEAVVGNAVSCVVLVITVLLLWRARRSERPPSWGLWLLCLAHTSFNGVYLPLGPLLVLVSLLAGLPRRAQPTRHSVD